MPRPSVDEIAPFAERVGNAHSWYKHFPLRDGGRFVCFLAADSGGLDYMWQLGPDDPWWKRDRNAPVELPDELLRLAIRAYPFVVYDLDPDEWASFHGDAIAAIAGGREHPYRDEIVAWHRAYVARRTAMRRMSDADFDVVAELGYRNTPIRDNAGNYPSSLSSDQQAWLAAHEAIHAIRLDVQRREVARIAAHIDDVLAWIG